MALPELQPLHVVDWIIFGAMMAVSLGIGVYYAFTGDKQKTTNEYLLGNRNMHIIPVTVSLMVSYISTITLIGYPAEVYSFGMQYWLGSFGVALGAVLACYIFVPVFYPLKLVSVNEYLLLRYESHLVKSLGSFCTIAGGIIYTGSVYFGPCTAIEAVSGFPAWASIIIGSIISTIYTTIGGLKAVIWTDVFQSFIMFAGMVAVVIVGVIATGGAASVVNINYEWGRLNLFDFDPDPTKRLNFYGVIFGNALMALGYYGYIQTAVQRYCSLPTLAQARRCLIGTIPGSMLLNFFSCSCGLVVFAYYTSLGCDPLKEGIISNPNQILPYFVVDKFRVPVLPGLFLASLSAASLSSASSALNSCAANMWEDIIKGQLPKMSEESNAKAIKVIVVIFGVLGTLIAIGMTYIGGSLVQIISVFGASIGGPVSSMYLMGIFLPWVNWKGASFGAIVGFCFGLWISIGSFSTEKNWVPLPTTTENCSATELLNSTIPYSALPYTEELTTLSAVTEQIEPVVLTGLQKLYSLSFLWIKDAINGVCIVVAVIFSFFTGFNKPQDVNPMTLHPFIRKALKLKVLEEDMLENDDCLDKEKTAFVEKNDLHSDASVNGSRNGHQKKIEITANETSI